MVTAFTETINLLLVTMANPAAQDCQPLVTMMAMSMADRAEVVPCWVRMSDSPALLSLLLNPETLWQRVSLC